MGEEGLVEERVVTAGFRSAWEGSGWLVRDGREGVVECSYRRGRGVKGNEKK